MALPTLTVPHDQAARRLDELIVAGVDIIARIRGLPPIPIQTTPHGLAKSEELVAIEADRTVWIDKAKHTLTLISTTTDLVDEFIPTTGRSISADQAWNSAALTRSMESSVLKLRSIRDRLVDFSVQPKAHILPSKPGLLDPVSSSGTLVDLLKRTHLGGLVLLALFLISGTWSIQYYLYVAPKEERLKQRDDRIAELERRFSDLSSSRSTTHPDDNGRTDESAGANDSSIVVAATEIYDVGSVQALSGQILITVATRQGKTHLRVTTPENTEGFYWEDLLPGDRREFAYLGDTLFVDVLSVKLVSQSLSSLANKYTTTIAVTKKLSQTHQAN